MHLNLLEIMPSRFNSISEPIEGGVVKIGIETSFSLFGIIPLPLPRLLSGDAYPFWISEAGEERGCGETCHRLN